MAGTFGPPHRRQKVDKVPYEKAAELLGIKVETLRKRLRQGSYYPFGSMLTGAAYGRYVIVRPMFEEYIGRELTDEEAGGPRLSKPLPRTHTRSGPTYESVSCGGQVIPIAELKTYPPYTEINLCYRGQGGSWYSARYYVIRKAWSVSLRASEWDAPVRAFYPLPKINVVYELVPGQTPDDIKARSDADAGHREALRTRNARKHLRGLERKARKQAYDRTAVELEDRQKRKDDKNDKTTEGTNDEDEDITGCKDGGQPDHPQGDQEGGDEQF